MAFVITADFGEVSVAEIFSELYCSHKYTFNLFKDKYYLCCAYIYYMITFTQL